MVKIYDDRFYHNDDHYDDRFDHNDQNLKISYILLIIPLS